MATHRTFIATYIMASGRNGTLYTGSTANLESRVWKYRARAFPGFTEENDCTRLARAADQEVAARLEADPDRTGQP